MAATDTDPGSYAEALTIDVPDLSIIGVSRGRTQGGQPQLKCSATALTTAIITVQVPGVLIANLGINGAGSTGGGIKTAPVMVSPQGRSYLNGDRTGNGTSAVHDTLPAQFAAGQDE